MNISDYLSLPVSPTTFPGLSAQLAIINQDYTAASSMAGDSITTPGSSQAGRYNQSLIKEIFDQKNLIATLSSIAATVPGASGWATWDINNLQNLIDQELQNFSNNSGTMSDEVAGARASISNNGAIQSNYMSGSQIYQSSGTGNSAIGSHIFQDGSNNYGSGFAIDELGAGNSGVGTGIQAFGSSNNLSGYVAIAIGSFNHVAGQYDRVVGNSNSISGNYDLAIGDHDTITGSNATIFGSDLTASTGQTVFGSASNYTVINADGTWSTIVNSQIAGSGTSASANYASILSQEAAASAAAIQTTSTAYDAIYSQYAATMSAVSGWTLDTASAWLSTW